MGLLAEISKIVDDALASLTAILVSQKVSSVDDVDKANDFTKEAIYSLRQKAIIEILSKTKEEVEGARLKPEDTAKIVKEYPLAFPIYHVKTAAEAQLQAIKKAIKE